MPDSENTLIMTLEGGPVTIKLRPDLAPGHVARIKELAREGFYDGVVFHRVIAGFMAQGGDPSGTGTGDSAICWPRAGCHPARGDDEEAGGRLARLDLADAAASPEVIDEVERLIVLTKGRTPAVGDRLGALMVSIDLSFLGEPPAVYAAY